MGSLIARAAVAVQRVCIAVQRVCIAAARGAFAAWSASRRDIVRLAEVVATAALGGGAVLWAAYIAGTAVRTFCDASRICGGA